MERISLKAARVNARLTQKEAAKRIGVTVLTLSKWESGKTEPKYSQAVKIGAVYGLPVDSIHFVERSKIN